jgi:PAS domain S-box-containing protein
LVGGYIKKLFYVEYRFLMMGLLVVVTEGLVMLLLPYLPEKLRLPADLFLLLILTGPMAYFLLIRQSLKRNLDYQRAKEKLGDEERWFRSLTESATDAIVCMDSCGKIFFWNLAAEKVFGYKAAEVLNKSISLIMPERLFGSHHAAVGKRLAGREFDSLSRTVEVVGARKDGSEFPTELSLSTWESKEGKYFTGIIRDITERKELEDKKNKLTETCRIQYEAAAKNSAELSNALNRAKSTEELLKAQYKKLELANRTSREFLARMSHEIRTPIHSTMGMISIALDSDLTEEQRNYLDTAMQSTETLLGVINDVLDFAKIEAGQMEICEAPFAVRPALEKIVKIMSPLCSRKGLRLVFSLPDNLPEYVTGDESRLRQVLLNLLSNALKFTEHGEINLMVERASKDIDPVEIRFTVRDTGIGIPEDKVPLVFDEFYQVNSSASRRYGGTGLGLAISRQIVEKMGGRISVESRVATGSTFWFSIKFKIPKENLSAAGNGSLPQVSVSFQSSPESPPRHKVIIAEDNLTAQTLARKSLEKRGNLVYTAGNGMEVLQVLKNYDVDIILMDVEMPVMNGLETTRVIRKQEAASGRHVPILAMTAYAMNDEKARCLESGMDGVISKPVKFSDVSAEIERRLTPKLTSEGVPDAADIPLALSMLDGDRELLREAVNLFLTEDYPRHWSGIINARRNADLEAMARAGHSIKGAAANVGGIKLGEYAGCLEKAAREGDPAGVERSLVSLVSEAARFSAFMKRAGLFNGDFIIV